MRIPPRISGTALAALAKLARTAPGSNLIYRILRSDLGINELGRLSDAWRDDVALETRPRMSRPPRELDRLEFSGSAVDAGHAWPRTSNDLTRGYRAGRTRPAEVVQRALAAAHRFAMRAPSVGPILDFNEGDALHEAELADARYREGRPKGPLDGVPVVVKEEMAVRGLPRRSGTRLVASTPCAEDSTVVTRLRAAGAIVLGTTPMTEYGMTPTGANPHRLMPRNPHATDRLAGGSSTGSGVAVATGVCPLAMGCDGGGSIRIPSATNGVFGIKPTWGRVSRSGDTAAGSVAHVGPIGASTLDLALALDAVAGPDPNDDQTLGQMDNLDFSSALHRSVRGLVIGLPDREWADADSAVTVPCRTALSALEKGGARVVAVDLELLKHAPAIGYATIGIEALALLRAEWRDHRDEMSHDLQITFSALEWTPAAEHQDAMRLRQGLRREVQKMFAGIDLLALPTLAQTARRVSDGEMATGFLDPAVLAAACRFNFLGNLTGLPALSCPVGMDGEGLPVGLQLVGDAWDEATTLTASAHLERAGVAVVLRPAVFVDLLE
jgi:aspartyl-tRNA(Asn)/glutamyl-tRNA(Gln) amidotransferase subunit A